MCLRDRQGRSSGPSTFRSSIEACDPYTTLPSRTRTRFPANLGSGLRRSTGPGSRGACRSRTARRWNRRMEMRTIALIVGVLGAGPVASAPGDAQEFRYWGKQADTATGWIEIGRASYEIRPGTEIPGWGRVREVAESHLVGERVLTESEKG